MPKTCLTPSALRDSIRVSAALIGTGDATSERASFRRPRGGWKACPSGLGGGRARRVPAGARLDRALDRVALVTLDDPEHRLDQLLAEMVGLQAEVEQVGVDRVVVVLFLLDPGVVDVVDRHLVAEVPGGGLDQLGELEDRELLGELVEDAEFARLGRVGDRQLDAGEGVADVEEAAGLTAGAVD